MSSARDDDELLAELGSAGRRPPRGYGPRWLPRASALGAAGWIEGFHNTVPSRGLLCCRTVLELKPGKALTGEKFAQFIRTEAEKYDKLIKDIGIPKM